MRDTASGSVNLPKPSRIQEAVSFSEIDAQLKVCFEPIVFSRVEWSYEEGQWIFLSGAPDRVFRESVMGGCYEVMTTAAQ